MKVFHLETPSADIDIVIDNIAYIVEEGSSHTLVLTDGKSYPLTESEYEEIKSYLMQ